MRIFLSILFTLIFSLGFFTCGKKSKNQETSAEEGSLESFLPDDWDGKSDYSGSALKVISL